MNAKILFFAFLGAGLFASSVNATEAQSPAPAAAVANAAAEAKAAPAKQEDAVNNAPLALSTDAVKELEARKQAQDARERELDERARALDVQEKILKEKLAKMEELNQKMSERLDSYKKEHEDRVTKLVSVVESMKPQAAAEYMENLDANLAVEVISRMQVTKAAKILNLVDKKKGAHLTELYTGYRDSMSADDKKQTAEKKEVPATNTTM